MPNRQAHTIAGGLVGLLPPLQSTGKPQSALDAIVGVVCGIAGGMLPDLLEPADSWNHRSHFHSAFAGGTAMAALFKLDDPRIPRMIQVGMKSFCLGYLSHLAMDATTKAGVPLA